MMGRGEPKAWDQAQGVIKTAKAKQPDRHT